ncbi:MAG TPA: DUF3311 domain-containing protein [Thermoanaerobaculia bacterium]|jgi:hypothetical protein
MREKNAWRWPLYAALLVLYLLHNDLWLWNDATLVFGLPVGLVYHVGFSIAASIVLTLLVLKAWPDHLEVPDSADVKRRESEP